MKKVLSTVLAIVLVCVCFTSCGDPEENQIKNKLCGEWMLGDVNIFGDRFINTYKFNKNGTYDYTFSSGSDSRKESGKYEIDIEATSIILSDDDGDVRTFHYELVGDEVQLFDGLGVQYFRA